MFQLIAKKVEGCQIYIQLQNAKSRTTFVIGNYPRWFWWRFIITLHLIAI